MAILGRPQGVFELNNSDKSIGSFFTKDDIKEFLGVNDSDVDFLKFKVVDGFEVIDERKIQKAWYGGEINNAPPVECSSLDEFILISIIREALPNCEIERQIRIKRFKMDFKITYKGKSILKIDCLPSNKRVFLKWFDQEEFYIRHGPSSLKLAGGDLIDYVRYRFG